MRELKITPLAAAAASCLALLAAGGTTAAAEVTGATVSAAFAPDGTLWRATPRQSWLEVDASADLGRSFSKPVRVNPGRQRLRAQPEDRPQIGVDGGGNVFVVFAADARQPWTRFVSVSSDGGRTFSNPAPLSSRAEGSIQYEPALQVDPNRGARVFWIEPEAHAADRHSAVGSLYVRAVSAGSPGIGPAADLQLHDAMCECCRMATAKAVGGSVAVFARLVLNGGTRDHGIIMVKADGAALPARRVTDDEWQINACPESGPALAIGADGRYHLSWFTQGRTRQGLFYAWSDNEGMTLSTPVAVGQSSALASHAHVAVADKTAVLAWQQFDGRTTSIHVMTSGDNGATWSASRELGRTAKAADYPFVLAHGDRFFVSWYAEDLGYQLIPVPPAGA